MVKTEEGTFATRDGTELYTKKWVPGNPSFLSLIFIHGFSDHINAYYNLFPTLASPPYNITVYGFDQRGWGRSAHKKSDWGLTGDTHEVLTDINDFISYVSNSIPTAKDEAKLFLMGHSMGGAESIMYMLSEPQTLTKHGSSPSLPISGLLLESPHVGFPPSSQPSQFTVIAGRIAAKILPNMQLVQKLDPSFMCRDPQVCKDWQTDPLCHDTGTLRGLAGLLDRANYLKGFASGTVKVHSGMVSALPCPAWWAHGTGDKVCDFTASHKLYDTLIANGSPHESSKESKFMAYEGGYHKLHGEPDGMGEQFAKNAGDWILQIAGAGKENNSTQASYGGSSTVRPDNKTGADADNVKSRL